MDQIPQNTSNSQNPQASIGKPNKKSNLSLIIILILLIVAIFVLIIAIIIINNQPVPESSNSAADETPLEAEIEEAINNANEPSKESSTLDCVRDMTAEEIATFGAVSGKVEIVADFESDNSLGNISLYKTIIGPSTDVDNPGAPGDEFLVENTTDTADTLNSSSLPTYYLTEGNTEKSKAKSTWTTQGFTCTE